MIKLKTGSKCTQKGTAMLICPNCGERAPTPIFKAETSLLLISVRVHEIHDSFFAVCTKCCHSFEASEWK